MLPILAGFAFLGLAVKRPVMLQEPFLLAFATAGSEAAHPKVLEQSAKPPISCEVSSFVLPLGYSFNPDRTMACCTLASMFTAQAHDARRSSARRPPCC